VLCSIDSVKLNKIGNYYYSINGELCNLYNGIIYFTDTIYQYDSLITKAGDTRTIFPTNTTFTGDKFLKYQFNPNSANMMFDPQFGIWKKTFNFDLTDINNNLINTQFIFSNYPNGTIFQLNHKF
jgi:hypothetical protein